MKKQKKGFTLVEVLVLICVFVLFIAIIIPSLSRARELDKKVLCANNLKQIGLAIGAYSEQYDGQMPWWGYTTGGSEEMHPYVAYRGDRIDFIDLTTRKPKPMRLACLHEAGYVKDPRIFYCPANRISLYWYESYIKYKGKPTKWGFLPQDFNTLDPDGNSHNQWVRFGYTYYPTEPLSEMLTGSVINYPKYVARKLANLDPRIPYTADMMRRLEDLSHEKQGVYGVNALFSDGSVVFCNDQDVFEDIIWEAWEDAMINWKEFYYGVFNLIGGSVR